MTTLIKIKRDSIKKNPNAGRDTYHVPMRWKGEFETNVPREGLPAYFKNHISSWSCSPNESIYSGELFEQPPEDMIAYIQDVIAKGFKFEVKFNREIQTIYSNTPEPEYRYQYENTPVECNNCHTMVPVEDIEEDEFEETLMKICPKCNFWNTFDFEYEKIEEVIKE
jgi:hypothetical protein